MTKIAIWRRKRDEAGLSAAPDESVDISDIVPLSAYLAPYADKSDPLNQLVIVGFKIGDAIGVNATAEWQDGDHWSPQFAEAIRGLLLYAIDNAAELRDLLKANR
jgi:hypothetical protein